MDYMKDLIGSQRMFQNQRSSHNHSLSYSLLTNYTHINQFIRKLLKKYYGVKVTATDTKSASISSTQNVIVNSPPTVSTVSNY